jgi:hypothetical protein
MWRTLKLAATISRTKMRCKRMRAITGEAGKFASPATRGVEGTGSGMGYFEYRAGRVETADPIGDKAALEITPL